MKNTKTKKELSSNLEKDWVVKDSVYILNKDYTAGSYLNERLEEIGLKK